METNNNNQKELTDEEIDQKIEDTILGQIRVGNEPKLRMADYNVARMIKVELELKGFLSPGLIKSCKEKDKKIKLLWTDIYFLEHRRNFLHNEIEILHSKLKKKSPNK